jgi:hypothetical protein
VLALMVARNSFGRDRIRLALICPSPRSGFSPAVEESVLEHNYRLTVIRPQSLAKLPTSGPGQLPYCPSERSRWRGGRYRVPDAGGVGDSRVANLKNDRSRVTMRRIVDWGVMDRSMIINNYPFAEFRFWQGFPGEKRLKFHR